MITAKVRTKSNSNWDKFKSQFKTLNRREIQVGHFEDQGEHYSGYTYPELLKMWHMGVTPGHEGIYRSSINQFINVNLEQGLLNRGDFLAIVKQFVNNADSSSSAISFLNALSPKLAEEYKQIFGEVGYYMPPDTDDTPLEETGDLRDKVEGRIV